MGVLTTLRCKVGRHSGTWSAPNDRCEVFRVCDSCGKVEEHKRHVWGAFVYLTGDQCDQRRSCDRCGLTESRIRHQWGPWLYRDQQRTSGQVRVCRRCDQQERTRYTLPERSR
jgi:hypothetical protein